MFPYPKITAFHNNILFSVGAPLTPAGGSVCNLKENKEIRYSVLFRNHGRQIIDTTNSLLTEGTSPL